MEHELGQQQQRREVTQLAQRRLPATASVMVSIEAIEDTT